MITPHSYQNGSHQILQIASVGKYVEKREPLYIVNGNINWCNHYGKQYGAFSKEKKKKAKTKLLYGRACPLLGLYLEKTKTLIPKDTFIPIFMPELFDSQDIETYSFYL